MPDTIYKTAIQTEEELESAKELFFAKTDGQVTKIGTNSVTEGLLFAMVKIGQLINTDVLNLRADNSPDLAFGTQLDNYATRNGYTPRFSATQSSTYIFINAAVGTIYLANTNFFVATNGETFQLTDDVTIGNIGFVYAKIQSLNSGSNVNVDAGSITRCNPQPTGHVFCWNDFSCTGGRDAESDTDFRNRIKSTLNILAIGTLAQYEQILQLANNRVLNVFKGGVDIDTNKLSLFVSSVNGINFSSAEFDAMELYLDDYLSLSDQVLGVKCQNVSYLTLDISMRVELQTGVDPNKVRVQMQRNIQRKYDYRYLKAGDIISRNDLILLAQNTTGVKRILNNYFYPLTDTTLPELTFVQFRSFILYDIDGVVISDNNNTSSSVYSNFFANYTDTTFQELINETL